MNSVLQLIQEFLQEENGPTVVEYAVLLAMIVVGIIGIVLILGQQVAGIYTNSSNEIVIVPGA